MVTYTFGFDTKYTVNLSIFKQFVVQIHAKKKLARLTTGLKQ